PDPPPPAPAARATAAAASAPGCARSTATARSRGDGTPRGSPRASSTTSRRRDLRGGQCVPETAEGSSFDDSWVACADESGELLQIDVAARNDGDNLFAPIAAAVARGRRAAAQRGGDGAAGGAFGDDVRPLGGQLHRLRDVLERHHNRAGDRREERPHRRQYRLAAGAVHERRLPVVDVDRAA